MACGPYQLNTEEACPEKAAGERSTSHFIAKDTPLNTTGRATSVLKHYSHLLSETCSTQRRPRMRSQGNQERGCALPAQWTLW